MYKNGNFVPLSRQNAKCVIDVPVGMSDEEIEEAVQRIIDNLLREEELSNEKEDSKGTIDNNKNKKIIFFFIGMSIVFHNCVIYATT